MRGVSTRNYEPALRKMADTAGVSKSAVSREWIEASSAQLDALQARSLAQLNVLVVYLDGMVFGDHHVLAAMGVDREGVKHVLGVASGSSENYHVAKDLLCNLIERGLHPGRLRLFVIDGSKALRKAIVELFGPHNPIQRCRAHKIRNVTERLPREKRADATQRMRAAYRLEADDGIAKLTTLAAWLDKDGHADAANSLREGLEETFTINRLGLTSSLARCLGSTNIIENPNGGVRTRTRRVSRWQDAQMALRWSATAFLECEKKFRKIMGYRDLWMLSAKLKELEEQNGLVQAEKVA
jgi:putative transposase